MTKKPLTRNASPFENLKRLDANGVEYWRARDLQGILGYQQWRVFLNTIKRAIHACKISNNAPELHFVKTKQLHAENIRAQVDYYLSRFGCYLIAQNADSRLSEAANAQKYFAVQTRRQEVSDAVAADLERLYVRKQTTKLFKALSGAARHAGVPSNMFRTFHDAGYRGLYGGLGSEAIKALKRILPAECLLDRMGTTELAANQFRMTQTRDKLAREHIHNPLQAVLTHQLVGQEVRQAIARIGGSMPEKLAPAEHIKQVEKRIKHATKHIQLTEKDYLNPEKILLQTAKE